MKTLIIKELQSSEDLFTIYNDNTTIPRIGEKLTFTHKEGNYRVVDVHYNYTKTAQYTSDLQITLLVEKFIKE